MVRRVVTVGADGPAPTDSFGIDGTSSAVYSYWETPVAAKRGSSTSVTKLLAVIVILLIVVSSGMVILLGLLPTGTSGQVVRVAIIDSGINIGHSLEGRVVAQKSFVSTEYGYDLNDASTSDAEPDGVPHGTLVSTVVVQNSDSAYLVIAKVIGPQGAATTAGIVAAMYWAIEQNCSVINLSMGSTPTFGDPGKQAVQYAFSHGVVVVASAGNEGDSGIAGTSIASPGVFPACLSVAGIDDNNDPYYFSSLGPTESRYMKPDIAALGYVETTTAIYYGTSFSSPRVAAAAANIVAYCRANNRSWTPGLVMTALLKGADPIPWPEYLVGAGALNVNNAIQLIAESTEPQDLPAMAYVSPVSLPLDFERLFYGDEYEFELTLFTTKLAVFDVQVVTAAPSVFHLPDAVTINQTGLVPLKVEVPDNGSATYSADIQFVSETGGSANVSVDFSVTTPVARVAFDVSHTAWSMDTVYGQFKELYKKLTSNSISVTELRNRSATTFETLSQYDAVLLLDPCTWEVNETEPLAPIAFSIPFSQAEEEAYQQYFEAGHGIFVAALSNDSLDISSLNEFLNWTGFSLSHTGVPPGDSPALITDITEHAITAGVSGFDYLGSTVSIPAGATSLAGYSSDTVLACRQGSGGGRIVVTGSNFFVDNWGMVGRYNSLDDDVLALNIVQWLTRL